MRLSGWLKPGPAAPARSAGVERPERGEGSHPRSTLTGGRPRGRTTSADKVRAVVSSILFVAAATLFLWAYETSLSGDLRSMSLNTVRDGLRHLLERTS